MPDGARGKQQLAATSPTFQLCKGPDSVNLFRMQGTNPTGDSKFMTAEKKPGEPAKLTSDDIDLALAEYYDACVAKGSDSLAAANIREKYAANEEFREGISDTHFLIELAKRRDKRLGDQGRGL